MELHGSWTFLAYISRRSWRILSLGADPYLPSRHIESFLRVFKQFACNIPRG